MVSHTNRIKALLYCSVFINIGLIVLLFAVEQKSHVFALTLERRGYVTLEDRIHPDYWARFSWENSIEKLHTDFDIAFFGNSITRGSDFQQAFPDKRIINLGYSGDNLTGMLRRVSMLKKSNAKKIFIMAGTNDLLQGVSLENYELRYCQLLTAIKDSIPACKIFIQSVLPINGGGVSIKKIQDANDIVEALSKQLHCQYIDLYSLYANQDGKLPKEMTKDGIHLYSASYNRWIDKIKPYIYE